MRFWSDKFRSPFEQVKAAAAKKSDAAKQSTAPSEGPALQQALVQQSLDSLAEESACTALQYFTLRVTLPMVLL